LTWIVNNQSDTNLRPISTVFGFQIWDAKLIASRLPTNFSNFKHNGVAFKIGHLNEIIGKQPLSFAVTFF